MLLAVGQFLHVDLHRHRLTDRHKVGDIERIVAEMCRCLVVAAVRRDIRGQRHLLVSYGCDDIILSTTGAELRSFESELRRYEGEAFFRCQREGDGISLLVVSHGIGLRLESIIGSTIHTLVHRREITAYCHGSYRYQSLSRHRGIHITLANGA